MARMKVLRVGPGLTRLCAQQPMMDLCFPVSASSGQKLRHVSMFNVLGRHSTRCGRVRVQGT